jgi:hypothetical protein
MRSCLHDLWTWLLKRRVIRPHEMPEFPAIEYELGWRNIIDIPTQQAIIGKVQELSEGINPKIYIGIRFLMDEDRDLLNRFPEGLPDLHFFRHPGGIKGCKAGERFGSRYLWKWWKKASNLLGVSDVDLYGGTRHSTVTALGESLTPEQIRSGTLHSTNKAFERYFQGQARNARRVYETVLSLQQRTKIQ